VTPEVIAIATSPVNPVIFTVNEVEVVDDGCFLIFASPLYPDKLEALPSDSVELNVSVKSAP
jgi:hypothetical protein